MKKSSDIFINHVTGCPEPPMRFSKQYQQSFSALEDKMFNYNHFPQISNLSDTSNMSNSFTQSSASVKKKPSPSNKIHISGGEKKIGVKTLLNTKSRMNYPFQDLASEPHQTSKNINNNQCYPSLAENSGRISDNCWTSNLETDPVNKYWINPVSDNAWTDSETRIDVDEITLSNAEQSAIHDTIRDTPDVISHNDTSNSTSNDAPNITSDIIPQDTPDVIPNITSDIIPNITPDVIPNIASDIIPNITSDIIPNITSDAIPNITPDIIPQDTPDVIPNITPDAIPNITSDDTLSDVNYCIPTPISKDASASYTEPNHPPAIEEKSLDIKNQTLNIVNMNIKPVNTNLPFKALNIVEPIVAIPDNNSLITDSVVKDKEFVWPALSIDMIMATLKVIGDLSVGAKLKVVNNTHLAEDNSYMRSLYVKDQGRDKIVSFLNHLYHETDRSLKEIVADIRAGRDTDTKLSVLESLVGKLFIFLHRFENMRDVYRKDSSIFAILAIIRDKFYTMRSTFFREALIPRVKN